MLRRVLVLERNQKTAERLVAALKQSGPIAVSLVPTMREACLIVAQQSQDLAFIPLEDAEQLLHSLRALQPDLNMFLTTADPQAVMSSEDQMGFQGLLHTTVLETELPLLLSGYKWPTRSMWAGREMEAVWRPGLAGLQRACQELGLNSGSSAVQMAILSFGEQLIGYCGQGRKSQALTVVALIDRNWQKGQYNAQLQYLQLPDYYDARLLYSRLVGGAVLSLVAEPEISISDLRKTADKLAQHLSGSKQKPSETARSHFTAIGRSNGLNLEERPSSTFAIAWRPVKPLPAILQKVVSRTIPALAKENGCRLHHLSVTPTIVHLVVACPNGKTAAWAVFCLKSGINQQIQQQFGTRSSIWRKGFYAVESDQPLQEAELNMLLAP